jgi:hypothetical protein
MARKPKTTRTAEASTTVAEPELPALDTAPAPARRGRPRKIPQAAPPEDSNDTAMDVAHADMANGSEMHASGGEENVATGEPATEATPAPAASKPAAQWDRTTDTAHFDWSEIERTAAQQGPNQVMAKLLLAARAEGANSRWPF